MFAEHVDRHDFERPFMRGRKKDRCGAAVHMRAEPVGRGDAPPVTRVQSWEAMHGHRCAQVVADLSLVFKELGRDDSTDRVTAKILRPGAAAAIPEESGERINAARLKLTAEDIALTHDASLLRASS